MVLAPKERKRLKLIGQGINDKLDYKTLSYNFSHHNTYLDLKDLPRHHDPEAFYHNELEPEDFYK